MVGTWSESRSISASNDPSETGGVPHRPPTRPRVEWDSGSWSRPGKATADIMFKGVIEIPRTAYVVLFVLVMVAVVVSVDLLFFRDRFLERLLANIGIVLVFVAFYFRFLKNL